MDENSIEVIVIATVHMPYQRRQYQQRSTNRVSSINVSSRKLNIFSRINAFSIVICMMMLMMVMMMMLMMNDDGDDDVDDVDDGDDDHDDRV